MSNNLNMLLKRIRPEIQEPPKPSKNLLLLLQRVELSRWRDGTVEDIKGIIETVKGQLYLIEHSRTCELCMAELQISVERYAGTRSPWFLQIENEYSHPEIYEEGDEGYYETFHLNGEKSIYTTCPRVQDYKIGSYWSQVKRVRSGLPIGENETKKFIMARFKWAEDILKAECTAATTFLEALKIWNLSSPLPDYNSNLYPYYATPGYSFCEDGLDLARESDQQLHSRLLLAKASPINNELTGGDLAKARGMKHE